MTEKSDFQKWQEQVESELGFLCNRGLSHFPDVDLRALWQSVANPEEVAGRMFVATLPGTGVELPRKSDARAASSPGEPGETRYIDGRAEFSDGEQWLSEGEAIDVLGELIREEHLGGGGYGGPGEYSIVWRIWRIGSKWLLDMSEEGLGRILCETKEECEALWEAKVGEHYPSRQNE